MSLSLRKIGRRSAVLSLFAGCARKPKGNPYAGRWEGKLSNAISSLMLQFDFLERGNEQLELRASARDLFLASHPIADWSIEGTNIRFSLPLLEGSKRFEGFFSGPTFDVESKTTQEKLHVRQLGRVPQLPYQEDADGNLTPTNRSVRAKVQLFGSSPLLRHFHADLLAKLGIATVKPGTEGAGILAVEDVPLPEPAPGIPFAMILSPSRERIAELVKYPCPIFVMLGEADDRFTKLERGARQVAFELREALTKQGRKPDSFQIRLAPQSDRTLRVKGFGQEYPRLSPQYTDHFRIFFSSDTISGKP
jgi:hypothetical protein